MGDKQRVDFNSIFCGLRPEVGRFRLAQNGIGWKGGNDRTTTAASEDLKKFTWIRAARGFELRVLLSDNSVLKFDGFKPEVSHIYLFLSIIC
jgi:structure-specific recognition protein 1